MAGRVIGVSKLVIFFSIIKSMDYVQCTHDSPLLLAAWHPHRFLGSLHLKGSISPLAIPSGITPVPVPKQVGRRLHSEFLCEVSEVAQSCPNFCHPMDCSLPGYSVHGIFQARILEWVAISFSKGSSQPRDQTRVSCIVGRRFTVWATREAQFSYSLLNKAV